METLELERIDLLQARQDAARFTLYLAALDTRHAATGRHIIAEGPLEIRAALITPRDVSGPK